MRLNKIITAAATSVALISAPAFAAPTASAAQIDVAARASAGDDAESELFRGRRGGALVFILIAVVIAVGVYIVVDDDNNEAPASP